MNPQEENKMIKLSVEGVKRLLGFNNLSSIYNFNVESKESLKYLLNVLSVQDNEDVVKKGLEYFRNEYRCRPEYYPGDYIFYDMFSLSMKKGFSLTESYDNCIRIIDRNMKIIDYCRAFGYLPQINWFD